MHSVLEALTLFAVYQKINAIQSVKVVTGASHTLVRFKTPCVCVCVCVCVF